MKKRAWLNLSMALLISVPLTTGCWDRIEIEERGTILAISIDPAPAPLENSTGPAAAAAAPGYRVTAQVAIPGRIPLGPGGGEGPGGGSTAKSLWLVGADGKTIDAAMNSLQRELAEKIFLGQLRIIIVNQQLASDVGMYDIEDFFRRNAEIRRLAWLIISKGSAVAAMMATPKLERLPTLYMVSIMDHGVQLGRIPNIFLGNYWTVQSSLGQESILPYISVRGKDEIRLEGLAVFHGHKLVTTLKPLEVASYMEIMGEKRAGYSVAFPVPGDPNHSVTLRGLNRRSRLKVHLVQGQPVVDVYSRVEGNIEERTGSQQLDSLIGPISMEVAQTLQKNEQALIERMQQLHTDIFGFGEMMRGQYPAYWKTIESKEKWDEQFANISTRVHVTFLFRRKGMKADAETVD